MICKDKTPFIKTYAISELGSYSSVFLETENQSSVNCVTNDCIKSIHRASKSRHQPWNSVRNYIQPDDTTGCWCSHLPPDSSLASEVATMRPQHQLAQWPAWQKINLPKQGFLSDQLAELPHPALTDFSTQYNISRGNRWDGGSVGLPLLNTASTQTTLSAKPSRTLRYS